MRQPKTVAQVILILSIVNFVLAAPAVRKIHGARNDVMARVLAEDVGPVKQFKIFGIPIIPWKDSDSDSDSGDEGYETASDDEGYETAPDEPSDHSSTLSDGPSDYSSTSTQQKRPKIMTPARIKATKIALGVGIFTAAVLGLVGIQVSLKNSTAS
jgi:hypothetical protein